MDDSILTSVKKLLGIPAEVTHFDMDLVMHINSVFMILTQLGVGPSTGFAISDASATWADFIPESSNLSGPVNFAIVKSYMGQRVKLLFDPPLASAVMEATKQSVQELEWRLYVAADPIEESEVKNQNGILES